MTVKEDVKRGLAAGAVLLLAIACMFAIIAGAGLVSSL